MAAIKGASALVVLVVIGAIILWMLSGLGQALQTLTTSVETLIMQASVNYNNHAVVRHPEIAPQIRSCLENKPPYMTFKALNHPTFYFICEFSPEMWGIQAVDRSGEEKTAFAPGEETGDFSFAGVKQYLDQFATRYTGALPWSH